MAEEVTRWHFDATWSGQTLHENDCMIPWKEGEWVRYKNHAAALEQAEAAGYRRGVTEALIMARNRTECVIDCCKPRLMLGLAELEDDCARLLSEKEEPK